MQKNASGMKALNRTNENIKVNTKNLWCILQFFILLLYRQISKLAERKGKQKDK